ncbi:hypothetical protein AAF712_010518 [Marasmius tenuissimus]|uniref:Uncharacterized protein n=1 Tax=Marasmius tenuissimus TaxID=585030 RepID=A0ABR2ZN21_9AGAR
MSNKCAISSAKAFVESALAPFCTTFLLFNRMDHFLPFPHICCLYIDVSQASHVSSSSRSFGVHVLDALGSAPFKVLVLEGIQQGSLTLLERIVQLFPDLVGLTLTRVVVWPHQCGEYALRFQGFRRLRYFGWNFSSEGYDYRYSPATLDLFESSALVERAEYEICRGEGDDVRGDDSSVTRVFGCYCPSLELVMLEGQPMEPYVISRGTRYDGDVIAYRDDMGGGKDWNPDSVFHQGWKIVDSNEGLVKAVS